MGNRRGQLSTGGATILLTLAGVAGNFATDGKTNPWAWGGLAVLMLAGTALTLGGQRPAASPAPLAAESDQQQATGWAPSRIALVDSYLSTIIAEQAQLQLPLPDRNGRGVEVDLEQLYFDVPLLVDYEHGPAASDLTAVHKAITGAPASSLWTDRAARYDDGRRDTDISQELGPGRRLVIIGRPGSGKSTLLQWLALRYGLRRLKHSPVSPLPDRSWVPILIRCRDLPGADFPRRLDDLLHTHLEAKQVARTEIPPLVEELMSLLNRGDAMLLVDGVDEIAGAGNRRALCELLRSLAQLSPAAPVVVTSRVVAFETVRNQLSSSYDHLLVAPLDRAAKQTFANRWSQLLGLNPLEAEALVHEVCARRATALITQDIQILALVAQARALGEELPARRLDMYRRVIDVMIERRHQASTDDVTPNELVPHLEHLAYSMKANQVQLLRDTSVCESFDALRRREPEESVLSRRSSQDLLRVCVDSIGVLQVAGVEIDERGFDREVIEFFHGTFQEYFAAGAIRHGHADDRTTDAVGTVRRLVAGMDFGEVTLRPGSRLRAEMVVADHWQESIRQAIAELAPGSADDALLLLLPAAGTPAEQVRPRVVFALQCLAEEPNISEATLTTLLDAVVDSLLVHDGTGRLTTSMDAALAAVATSRFAAPLHDRLLDAFIQGVGVNRLPAGLCLLSGQPADPVTAGNSSEFIARAEAGLSADSQAARVDAALEVTERCFRTDGQLGLLEQEEQQKIAALLAQSLGLDGATQVASMWALMWLTGAKYRSRGPWPPDPDGTPSGDQLLLDASAMAQVEAVLQRPDTDALAQTFGLLVLTRQSGLAPVFEQFDWIYAIAVVADGGTPRRELPQHRPAGRQGEHGWLHAFLQSPSDQVRSAAAVALASFGVFTADMVEPLAARLNDPWRSEDERDEAMVGLALIGTPEVVPILEEAANTPPEGEDDFLYERGLLGLLLLDDVEALERQLGLGADHADLNAYAFGLAGSRDPRGSAILASLAGHTDPRVRAAVERAQQRAETWDQPQA